MLCGGCVGLVWGWLFQMFGCIWVGFLEGGCLRVGRTRVGCLGSGCLGVGWSQIVCSGLFRVVVLGVGHFDFGHFYVARHRPIRICMCVVRVVCCVL